jgi:hypothetical protein
MHAGFGLQIDGQSRLSDREGESLNRLRGLRNLNGKNVNGLGVRDVGAGVGESRRSRIIRISVTGRAHLYIRA